MDSTGNKILALACCSLFIGLVGSWGYFLTSNTADQPFSLDKYSILITTIATVVVAAATVWLAVANYELNRLNLENYKLMKRQIVPNLIIFDAHVSLKHSSSTAYIATVTFTVTNDSGARGGMTPPELKLEGNDGCEFETDFLGKHPVINVDGGNIYPYKQDYTVDLTGIQLDNRYFSELKAILIYDDYTGMTRKYEVPTVGFDSPVSELVRRYGNP